MHWPKPGYARRDARGREEGEGNTGATGRLLRRPNTATDSKEGAHGGTRGSTMKRAQRH
jgi:hypothetical protein